LLVAFYGNNEKHPLMMGAFPLPGGTRLSLDRQADCCVPLASSFGVIAPGSTLAFDTLTALASNVSAMNRSRSVRLTRLRMIRLANLEVFIYCNSRLI
jgi:hypothetical protein